MSTSGLSDLRTQLPLERREELEKTARTLTTPGKGILVLDESAAVMSYRLGQFGLENTAEQRETYRMAVITTPGLGDHIMGIAFEADAFYEQSRPLAPPPPLAAAANGAAAAIPAAANGAAAPVAAESGAAIEAAAAAQALVVADEPSVAPSALVVEALNRRIMVGMQGDLAVAPLPGGRPGETRATGLDDFARRAAACHARGARFAKWRVTLPLGRDGAPPSELAVAENTWALARFAREAQEAGLLPIMQAVVSFERGLHPFERTAIAQELVLTELFAACRTNGVMLEGCLLQTSITAPGAERYSSSTLRNELWSADQARLSAEPGAAAVAREALSADAVNEVAKRELLAVPKATVRTLQRTVPPSVPGILFTSGGLSEEEASFFLCEINKVPRLGAWNLAFSYSRALQQTALRSYASAAFADDEARAGGTGERAMTPRPFFLPARDARRALALSLSRAFAGRREAGDGGHAEGGARARAREQQRGAVQVPARHGAEPRHADVQDGRGRRAEGAPATQGGVRAGLKPAFNT